MLVDLSVLTDKEIWFLNGTPEAIRFEEWVSLFLEEVEAAKEKACHTSKSNGENTL